MSSVKLKDEKDFYHFSSLIDARVAKPRVCCKWLVSSEIQRIYGSKEPSDLCTEESLWASENHGGSGDRLCDVLSRELVYVSKHGPNEAP